MTKKVYLSGKAGMGKFSIVDNADYDRVCLHKWCLAGKDGYAASRINGTRVLLHRFILGLGSMYPQVDHINHDTLDNRRENLRTVSNQQSMSNRLPYNRYSEFKGIRCRPNGKWEALITYNKVQKYLGIYNSPQDAARAYDDAARKLFGEYAHLNF